MNDGDALLAAIRDQPDEDTPRLMYADWLDEQGEHAHAAFVRDQIAASGTGGTFWDLSGRRGSPARFKAILAFKPWESPLHLAKARPNFGYLQPSASSSAVLWRRGFIEGVFCAGASLGPVLDELRAHPIREVRLCGLPRRSIIERLYPTWDHSDPAAPWMRSRKEDRARLLKLLTGPGGFPHLRYAAFEFTGVSKAVCPFQLCSKSSAA